MFCIVFQSGVIPKYYYCELCKYSSCYFNNYAKITIFILLYINYLIKETVKNKLQTIKANSPESPYILYK